MEQPFPSFPLGSILLGKYRLEEELGRGAFGVVYRATHLKLQASRAIKILARNTSGMGKERYAEMARRFRQEAQVGAKFEGHPHLIHVYEFEEDEDEGILALVMEYAPGGSLAQRLENEGALPVDEAVRIAREVALGLAALHQADIVHRDIKPSNILFDAQGRAKVADLGLAQVPHGPSRRSRLSMGINHPGTPHYMSPEQRDSPAPLRPSSDVYALGAVLFEMLTGRQYAIQPLDTRVRDLRPEVPQWLDDLTSLMLASDPKIRPQNGQEVARLLAEKGRRTEQRPRQKAEPAPQMFSPQPKPKKKEGKKAWQWWGGALLLFLMVVGGVWAAGFGNYQIERFFFVETTSPLNPSPFITPTQVLTSVPRQEPARTPAPSPTATATLFDSAQAEIASSRPSVPITAANAAQVREVVRWELSHHQEEIWISSYVAFSPDGELLASASSDSMVRLWRVMDGTLVWTLNAQASSLAFSPNGDFLAWGAFNGDLQLRRVSDGTLMWTIKKHTSPVISVVFSPDGEFLASGATHGPVRLWRVSDGTWVRTFKYTSGGHPLDFSPDGILLASGLCGEYDVRISLECLRGEVWLWRVSDGTLVRTLDGRVGDVWDVAFSPDGTLLAAATGGGIRLWRISDGTLLRTLEGDTSSVAFSPDGTLLASGETRGLIRLWRVSDGYLARTLDGHTWAVESLAFSPDGNLLASGSDDGTIRLWGVP